MIAEEKQRFSGRGARARRGSPEGHGRGGAGERATVKRPRGGEGGARRGARAPVRELRGAAGGTSENSEL